MGARTAVRAGCAISEHWFAERWPLSNSASTRARSFASLYLQRDQRDEM